MYTKTGMHMADPIASYSMAKAIHRFDFGNDEVRGCAAVV